MSCRLKDLAIDIARDGGEGQDSGRMSVAGYYAGKSIFVTGGTGFLGKAFIEKLLYSCKKIDKIYVLIREKKGRNVDTRIRELLSDSVFTRIKENSLNDLQKIIPVAGDISLPNLGIKDEDELLLSEEVSAVFHFAATIRFDESLGTALNFNVDGTKRILNLCGHMKNLNAFVHVSTAYANTDRELIDEIVYPPPLDYNEAYDFLEKYGDDEEETAKLLTKYQRPNTYTFTKAIAEDYVLKNRGDIPAIIVRPAIVTPSYKEPFEAWVDGLTSPGALMTAASKGFVRVIFGDGRCIANIIPVDYVANFIIVAAARGVRSNEVAIYNCCHSTSNSITWEALIRLFVSESVNCDIGEIPFPFVIFTKSKLVLHVITSLLQITPAYMFDFWLLGRGKKRKYVKIQNRLIQLRQVLQYFISRKWEIRRERGHELISSLSPEDRLLFPCDPIDIDWSKYIRIYVKAMKPHLAKSKL